MKIQSLPVLLALMAAGVVLEASAQTLYKLIDKNGKVTYAEAPPKDYDGQVIRIDVDPKANTATMPKFTPKPAGESAGARNEASRAARAKLDAARKALADARANPGEGDVARVGIKGGGTRPVLTEEYRDRLKRLEGEVKDAEAEVRKAERP